MCDECRNKCKCRCSTNQRASQSLGTDMLFLQCKYMAVITLMSTRTSAKCSTRQLARLNLLMDGWLFSLSVKCKVAHSCLKGSKTKKNSPVLRLVPFFVKLPHESPQKNWKSGHEGFLRNLHFCFSHYKISPSKGPKYP